ncbi:MAG: ABC transporter, partial [Calditrichaeota bacterium]|nr:ABC transporter [Calditrichota bacterium]
MRRARRAREAFEVDAEAIRLKISLRGGGPPGLLNALSDAVRAAPRQKVLVDLGEVPAMDSLGASLLSELLVRGHMAGKDIDYLNASPSVQQVLAAYFYPAPEVRISRDKPRFGEAVGGWFYRLRDDAWDLIFLISQTFYWSLVAIWRGDGHRKGAVTAQALQIGVGSLPVIGTIAFLIGIVLALQSAEQLRQFGANIFVADLLVISMTREMGPLMTAIVMAGRSGASIAAEIATMTVSEETDALTTMALNPLRFIVVPKVWGITLTMPFLAVLATVIGIGGGMIVAVASLDLAPRAFLIEAQSALYLKDVVTG